jgi:hypothetical protein
VHALVPRLQARASVILSSRQWVDLFARRRMRFHARRNTMAVRRTYYIAEKLKGTTAILFRSPREPTLGYASSNKYFYSVVWKGHWPVASTLLRRPGPKCLMMLRLWN